MPRFFAHSKHHEDGARLPMANGLHQPHGGSPGASRRSFFGLPLGKTSSNESQSSIMSDDHHHSHSNHGGVSTPVAAPAMNRNGSSSMVQLKKFFRPARKELHGHAGSSSNLGSMSPSPTGSNKKRSSSPAAPSAPMFTHDANNNMIVKTDPKFWDDLEGSVAKKYGKLGKVLGSGAGGSVRLIVRESDGVTFAVKEFVPRRANESIKEYAKKCTAEFCIGSTLHHPNVIQTLDIINENNHFYEVMEYAPIDFFAVVMSGKMTRSEINCCIKQISLGVNYLHSVGLAHRDLKLDNCVVTNEGIVKLIDFGSAVVFKYPFEADIVNAHGIVGSDPYLAPEVLTSTNDYNPQLVDIWSIGIIYCCMTLRRFPWKAPKADDPSFSLYCMEDDQPHDYVESARKHKELLQERKRKIIMAQKQKEEEIKAMIEKTNDMSLNAGCFAPNDLQSPHFSEKENVNGNECSVQPEENSVQADAQAGARPVESEALPGKSAAIAEPLPAQSAAIAPGVSQAPAAPQTPAVVAPQVEETKREPEAEAPRPNAVEHAASEHRHHHHNTPPPQGPQPEPRQASQKTQKQIHGPYRLMRLLPHAARPIISKMLAIELEQRATMKDILADEWFQEIKYCTMDEDGNTINDPSHTHTIV